MPAVPSRLITLALLAASAGAARAAPPDLAQLQEMLLDRQHPRSQSQAASPRVQSTAPEAEKVVRRGLQQAEDAEVFLALASAVRASQDGRFLEELLAALAAARPGVRQGAAEALAVLTEPNL